MKRVGNRHYQQQLQLVKPSSERRVGNVVYLTIALFEPSTFQRWRLILPPGGSGRFNIVEVVHQMIKVPWVVG